MLPRTVHLRGSDTTFNINIDDQNIDKEEELEFIDKLADDKPD
jgi:hypothetical protein